MSKKPVEEKQQTCCKECGQEKYAEIKNIIDLYKGKEGSLIQILHLAQEVYGYLPLDLQTIIADALGLPLSEVSGGGDVSIPSFRRSQGAGIRSGCVLAQPAMSGAVRRSWKA